MTLMTEMVQREKKIKNEIPKFNFQVIDIRNFIWIKEWLLK